MDNMQSMYTPEEIAHMKAQLEQMYQNSVIQNQNLNTAANMTKNLSPSANLGILLGTLGGKWAAQRLNDTFYKNAYDLYRQKDLQNRIANADFYSPENIVRPYLPKFQGGVEFGELPKYFPDSQFYTKPNQFKYDVNSRPWENNPNYSFTLPRPSSNQTSQNPIPSTALNPTTTNYTPNNAAPSTALLTNDTPYFDWRNQNYLTNQATRPPYFSIR